MGACDGAQVATPSFNEKARTAKVIRYLQQRKYNTQSYIPISCASGAKSRQNNARRAELVDEFCHSIDLIRSPIVNGRKG